MSENSKTADTQSVKLVTRLIKAVAVTLWIVVAFFTGAALTQLIDYLLSIVGLPLGSLSDAVESAVKAGLMYSLATLVAVGVPAIMRRAKPNIKLLGINRFPEWWDILLGPAAFIPYFILTLILTSLATLYIPGFDIKETQDVGFQTVTNKTGYIMAFFTLVVIAPLAEEILFRGYLYAKLRRYIGLIGAVVLTSLCFAALHLQLNVAVDVFALSVVLCLLREFTGSIWAGVLLHMSKNFIAFYFLFVAPMI